MDITVINSFLLLIRAKIIWAVLEEYKKALCYAETDSLWHALKSTYLKESKKERVIL